MKKTWILGLLLTVFVLSQGCKSVQTKKEVWSLQKLNCEGCGKKVVTYLKKQPGVKSVTFAKGKAELTVQVKPGNMNKTVWFKWIRKKGYDVQEGPGKGRYRPFPTYEKGLDVQTISKRGEHVRLEDHVQSGKLTIFDFYAVWCGPCKFMDHTLRELLAKNKHIALRKINIVDWGTPVAKKYMKKVPNLPYLIFFDPSGKRVASLHGLKMEKLKAIIAKYQPKK